MEERIDIVTVDRVDPSSATKIRAIADAADLAATSLDRLNKAGVTAGGGDGLGKLTAGLAQLASLAPKAAAVQAQLASANDRAALSWLRQEEALNRAVASEARAEQALARMSVAQSAAAIAAYKVNTAYLEQERALFRALEAEQNYTAATSRAELAQFKLQQAQDKATAATMAATAATRPQIQTLEELGRALGHTTAQTWEFIRVQAAAADRPAASPRLPFLDADLLALNKYNTAVLTATNYTEKFETAKAQASYAAGLSSRTTASFGSTSGAMFGYANPFGPGAPPPAATSGFAPGAGGAYSVSVQSARELALAQQQVAEQSAKAQAGLSSTGKAAGEVAQRGRLAAHEMANLGYQLQDIVVSLAGGQNPFMVLLQQGAQIQAIYSMRGEGVGKVFGDVAGILLRLVNPATVTAAALTAGAVAIGLFADKAGDIQKISQLLGMTAEQTQVLQKTLNMLSRGNMGFGEFTKEAKDFALALDDATRNPKSQLARLFQVNDKSLTDSTGKLKNQNDLWKMSIDLIRGAANEVQAIKVGEILGLTEDFTREIYKSKQGFTDVQSEVSKTGTILDDATVKKAAAFEKAWGDAWQKFETSAGDAITRVEAAIFGFLDKLAKDNSFGKWVESFIPGSLEYANNFNSALMGGIPPGYTANPVTGVPEPPFPMRDKGGPFPGLSKWLDNALTGSHSSSSPVVQGGGFGQLFNGSLQTLDVKTAADAAAEEALNAMAAALTSKGPVRLGFPVTGQGGGIASRPDADNSGVTPRSSTGGPARAGSGATILPPNSPPPDDKTAEKRADALDKINRELEAQLRLMGMLGPERRVEQQMSEIENSLAIKHIQLTETEKENIHAKLEELQRLQPVQAALNKLYEDAQGPLRDYNALVEAGTKLLAEGKISAQQYQDATRQAWEKVLEQQNSIGSGIELGFMQVYDDLKVGASGTADYVKQAFGGLENTFVQLATTGKINFSNLSDSILADLTRIIYRMLILKPLMEALGLGSGTGGGVGVPDGPKGQESLPSGGGGGLLSGLGSLLGFDGGGDFDVGGQPGVDRNVVMFKATRGERVSVSPASREAGRAARSGASAASAGGPVQIQVINNAPNAKVTKAQESRGPDGRRYVKMIVDEAVAQVADQIATGGTPLSKAIEGRFGLNSAAGIQT